MKFVHVNIIAKDWKKLAEFYQNVFSCVPVPPVRNLSGIEIERGTGIKNARIEGIHLRLPGIDSGPTLEIFQYMENEKNINKAVNKEGLAHLAFQTEDLANTLQQIKSAGGGQTGEQVIVKVEGAGKVSFVYASDPEGNIIELQKWHD